MEAFHFFIPVPREPDLNVVICVLRERIRDQCAPSRADRQALNVLLLGEIWSDADRVTARTAWRANGQSADLLRRRDITVEQCRREISYGYVVKPMTDVILGQQRAGIDIQRQKIPNCVLILCSVEPPERLSPAGIGMLGVFRVQ